jgi:hypothetical protein
MAYLLLKLLAYDSLSPIGAARGTPRIPIHAEGTDQTRTLSPQQGLFWPEWWGKVNSKK